MTARRWTDASLEAYLDESLSSSDMAALEAELRSNAKLLDRLSTIIGRRDAGVHTLGEIWRRHRASCPTREQLGSFLLGAADPKSSAYVTFHLETVGCRYCEANLEDLKLRQQESSDAADRRRQRYFQSSAGYLRRQRE
jgi:hypothetical protein